LNASNQCQELLAKCQFDKKGGSVHLKDPESLLLTGNNKVLFPIPAPISNREMHDLSEALMGDYGEQHFSTEALIGTPNPKELSEKLHNTNVRDKLLFQFGQTNFRFLLSLLIKAEINPLLAITEVLLTWIVILSCK
jgi:hypothetical protein